ncbi:L-threonylcarbamoyladenylate synthase [Pleomorphovibrio marinus]|uniref:L-threonylcarbamoyladenylate synthase n=1 Tax=Pleomorphovibrio marinus TaxID=2164132 RepID=UPI000E0A475C|nr:L-threonylcarbamoyladenylate synthase [Pleomorphovibrio marinus]
MTFVKNKIHTEIGTDLNLAADYLKKGELVAIPTETVYGLAGNALDTNAVLKIYQTKKRPSFDPLIVHVGGLEQVYPYVKEFPEELKELAEAFWPGPLTLLLPKQSIIPDLVTSGLDTVGIRVPHHPLTRELLMNLDFPLAAPSANPFGYISPTKATHVVDQLNGEIPYVLDGGDCQVGLESTIVGIEQGQVIVYRLGGVPVKRIEDRVGPLLILPQSSSNPKAPGMLKSHYAPQTPIVLGNLEEMIVKYSANGIPFGVLSFSKDYGRFQPKQQVVLSKVGDFEEAARNLFSGMRMLDNTGLAVILAEELPEENLGKAINDRLRRAAAK